MVASPPPPSGGDDGNGGGNSGGSGCQSDADCNLVDANAACAANRCDVGTGICSVEYFAGQYCGEKPPADGIHCWKDQAKCVDGVAECPAPAFQDKGFPCRPKNGACDIAEVCSGESLTCPVVDEVVAAGEVCDKAVLPCEENALCPGPAADASDLAAVTASKTCPEKPVSKPSKPCREAKDKCDVTEYCDGSLRTCPDDYYKTNGYWLKTSNNLFLCEIGTEWLAQRSLDGVQPGKGVTAYYPMIGYTSENGIISADCLDREVTLDCPPDATGKVQALSNVAFFECDPATGAWEVMGTKIEVDGERQ